MGHAPIYPHPKIIPVARVVPSPPNLEVLPPTQILIENPDIAVPRED